jgi:hypothetical protein
MVAFGCPPKPEGPFRVPYRVVKFEFPDALGAAWIPRTIAHMRAARRKRLDDLPRVVRRVIVHDRHSPINRLGGAGKRLLRDALDLTLTERTRSNARQARRQQFLRMIFIR